MERYSNKEYHIRLKRLQKQINHVKITNRNSERQVIVALFLFFSVLIIFLLKHRLSTDL